MGFRSGETPPTFEQKVAMLRRRFDLAGVDPAEATPRIYRLAWRLGWQVRPPAFQRPILLFLVYGLLIGGSVAGGVFGTWLAWSYARVHRNLNLPSWDEFGFPGDAGADSA